MRWTLVAGVVAAGALAARRVTELAQREGRPVGDVLQGLSDRLAQDLATVPDDLRMAVREGRLAAERRMGELDEQIRQAREPADGPPPQPSA